MSRSASVVIPCYRQAHFLADALESVLAQTHAAREIVVVNDGSPDRELLESVLAPFQSRVTYVTQDNRGLGGARNAGLAVCTGEFVVCLDSDDRLLPNALETGVRELAERPSRALVWGFNQSIDTAGNAIPYPREPVPARVGYAELLRGNVIGPPVGVMFRRTMLAAIGGFSTEVRFAEDYEVYLQLARRHEVHCHREVIAEYRRHGANMSGNHRGMLEAVGQVLDLQKPWVRHDPRLREALRAGRQRAREDFDWNPRIKRFHEAIRDHRWTDATASGSALFLRYPRRFSGRLGRRLLRFIVPAAA